jgi:GntR family transcriptional regulator
MDVLKQNGIPLYHQLKEIFIEKIENTEWPVGETIPNELLLCQQYNVSRGPVRQALDLLVREGLLTRKQGRGTIVMPPKVESGLTSFYSFTSLIEQSGKRPGGQLLGFDVVTIQANVAQRLKISPGDSCYKIRRLRLADKDPLILETVYVPLSVALDLKKEDVASRSLYEILSSTYATIPARTTQYLEPTIADEYEARELGISIGGAVLLVQNLTFDTADRPIVYSKAIIRGDQVRYFLEINTHIRMP